MQKIFYQLIIYLTASAFYQAPGGVQFAQIFRKSAAQPLYPPKPLPWVSPQERPSYII